MAQSSFAPDIGYGPGIRAPDADTGHGVQAWLGSDKLSPKDLDSTVRTVAAEAGNQGKDGQQAVAHVILNRAKNTGSSLHDIVSAPSQFEAWGNGNAAKISSTDYNNTLNAIMPVLAGQVPDNTNGATNYLNPKLQAADGRSQPKWAQGEPSAKIGDHVFYGEDNTPTAGQLLKGGKAVDSVPSASDSDIPTVGQLLASGKSLNSQPTAAPQAQSPGIQKAMADMNAKDAAINKAFKLNPNQTAPENALVGGYMQGLTANTIPIIGGALNGLNTGINNFLAKHFGIGTPTDYGMGDAFSAARQIGDQQLKTTAAAHPYLDAIGNTAGFLGSPILRGLSAAAAPTRAALTAAPRAAALAGRVTLGGLENGAAGALAGAGQGLSEGGSPSQVGQQVAVSGGLSALGGAAGELAAPLIVKGSEALAGRVHPALKPLAKVVLPAAAGSAMGGFFGGKEGAVTGGVLGMGAGGHFANRKAPIGEPSAKANDFANQHIVDKIGNGNLEETATKLENSPASTVAEVSPKHVVDLLKSATKENPTTIATLQEQVAARQHPDITVGKLSNEVKTATGINPAHAQMGVEDYLEQKKAANQKLWQPVNENEGEPVNTPEHQELLKTKPVIAQAIRQAQNILGDKGHAPNPDFNPNGVDLKTPHNITDEDFAEIANDRKGADVQGRVVPLPGPTQEAADYLNNKRGIDAGNEPETVPTQKAWTYAQEILNNKVSRDGITGRPKGKFADSTIQGVTNFEVNNMAQDVNRANKQHFEGLTEAKAATGEKYSFEHNKNLGADLNNNKNSETPESFAKRFETLSEPDKEATRHGYLQEFFRQYRDNPTGTIVKYLNNSHKAYQKILFEDNGQGFQKTLQDHLDVSRQAKEITDFSPSVKNDKAIAIPASVLGGASGSASKGVGAALHGAFAGLKIGIVAHALAPVAKAIEHGEMTPEVQKALANKLSMSPSELAKEIRDLKARKQNMPLSKSTLVQDFTKNALKGAGYAYGHAKANAFRGVNSN